MTVQRQALNSSALAAASYDDEAKTLELEFTSGRSYLYSQVPPEVFDDLVAAPSAGKFFNDFIKDIFF
jgi:hypothetical protein